MGDALVSIPFTDISVARRIVEAEALRRPLPAAIERVFTRMQDATAPLVGEQGFAALLARALALSETCAPLPRGDIGIEPRSIAASLAARAADLAPEAVLQCSVVVLDHLLDLLRTFIGEDLTARLVGRTWADELGGPHD